VTIEAFPLCWPDGWPRTAPGQRARSTFKVTTDAAISHLLAELKRSGGRNVVLSTNVPIRRDGRPYADAREPQDPGVGVYWDDRKGRSMAIGNDSWRTLRENIHALGLTIENIRAIHRYGSSEILERAFSGFARLPAAPDPWQVLGIERTADAEAVKARYRELAHQHHPDHGGDATTMARINQAYHEAVA